MLNNEKGTSRCLLDDERMNNQKNTTLEMIKLLASYMVVFIHVQFWGTMGGVMNALARFAVPLFFLISGFYSYQANPQKIRKRIRNVFTLLIFATVCCTLTNIIPLLLNGRLDLVVSYFKNYIDPTVLVRLLVFNVPVSSGHLWYLLAITYVYIIFYFTTLLRYNEKVIFIFSFLLLFINVLFGKWLSGVRIAASVSIVRNFVLMGIPFFGVGLFAKKHESKLRTIPYYAPVIFFAIGILVSILDYHYFGTSDLNAGSLFILFALVIVFIKYSAVQYPSFFMALEGCSTYIYIFHIAISVVIGKVYTLFGIDIASSVILTNIHPILVCIASTVFAYCVTKMFKLIHQKKQQKGEVR